MKQRLKTSAQFSLKLGTHNKDAPISAATTKFIPILLIYIIYQFKTYVLGHAIELMENVAGVIYFVSTYNIFHAHIKDSWFRFAGV